ncbi:MAG: Type 1 glutamine amidotransferase-like domain-containing protein [Myxococcota bacterium]|nr:Type 1 glutamine amidotransferase-like domain-containing protein [Myxococcota bacterium]
MNPKIHILGPQRDHPNLAQVVEKYLPDAKLAVISAGWRHEESELKPMARDLRRPLSLLPLYQWFDELGQQEPELSKEHSDRQKRIKAYKKIYRKKLHLHLEYLAFIEIKWKKQPSLYGEDHQEALDEIHKIDQEALQRLERIRSHFPNLQKPWKHPSAKPLHEEIRSTLEKCDGLIIAGGHVAILRNRMFFFGLPDLLREFLDKGKQIVCWSAGAMAMCEQIVLYYDDPPEGVGVAEILDTGMGILPNTTFFPHAAQRLRLNDSNRVRALVQRFHTQRCITLEVGTHLLYENGTYHNLGRLSAAAQMNLSGELASIGESQ